MRSWARLGILLLTLGIPPAPAHADSIALTSGALVYDLDTIRLNASGGRGLSIDASVDIESGTSGPLQCVRTDIGCLPGTTMSLVLDRVGVSSGMISLAGETFALGAGEEEGSLNFRFEGDLVLPEFSGARSATASAPFTFTGEIRLPWPSGTPFRPPVPIFGNGIATARFTWPIIDAVGGWRLRHLRYDFSEAAPVPEPMSLLLVGTGLAALARRRGRNRGSDLVFQHRASSETQVDH